MNKPTTLSTGRMKFVLSGRSVELQSALYHLRDASERTLAVRGFIENRNKGSYSLSLDLSVKNERELALTVLQKALGHEVMETDSPNLSQYVDSVTERGVAVEANLNMLSEEVPEGEWEIERVDDLDSQDNTYYFTRAQEISLTPQDQEDPIMVIDATKKSQCAELLALLQGRSPKKSKTNAHLRG